MEAVVVAAVAAVAGVVAAVAGAQEIRLRFPRRLCGAGTSVRAAGGPNFAGSPVGGVPEQCVDASRALSMAE